MLVASKLCYISKALLDLSGSVNYRMLVLHNNVLLQVSRRFGIYLSTHFETFDEWKHHNFNISLDLGNMYNFNTINQFLLGPLGRMYYLFLSFLRLLFSTSFTLLTLTVNIYNYITDGFNLRKVIDRSTLVTSLHFSFFNCGRM